MRPIGADNIVKIEGELDDALALQRAYRRRERTRLEHPDAIAAVTARCSDRPPIPRIITKAP